MDLQFCTLKTNSSRSHSGWVRIRKDCSRVHYEYENQTSDVKLLVTLCLRSNSKSLFILTSSFITFPYQFFSMTYDLLKTHFRLHCPTVIFTDFSSNCPFLPQTSSYTTKTHPLRQNSRRTFTPLFNVLSNGIRSLCLGLVPPFTYTFVSLSYVTFLMKPISKFKGVGMKGVNHV